MASSSAVKPYKAVSAALSFKVTEDSNWQTIPSTSKKYHPKDDNVGPIAIDYNLSLTQRTKTASCTVKYNLVDFGAVKVSWGPKNSDAIVVEMDLVGSGSLEYSPDEEESHQLPLAQQYDAIKYLRLSIQSSLLKRKQGPSRPPKIMASELEVHFTGEHTKALEKKRPIQVSSTVDLDAQIEEAKVKLFDAIRAARKAKEAVSEAQQKADRAAQAESDAKAKWLALEDEREERLREERHKRARHE